MNDLSQITDSSIKTIILETIKTIILETPLVKYFGYSTNNITKIIFLIVIHNCDRLSQKYFSLSVD